MLATEIGGLHIDISLQRCTPGPDDLVPTDHIVRIGKGIIVIEIVAYSLIHIGGWAGHLPIHPDIGCGCTIE